MLATGHTFSKPRAALALGVELLGPRSIHTCPEPSCASCLSADRAVILGELLWGGRIARLPLFFPLKYHFNMQLNKGGGEGSILTEKLKM